MRALVFHGPWELAVEERPDPEPGPGEVLIDVLATGICGSDLHGYTGETGRRVPGQVMGHETVGRIARIGGADGGIPDLAEGTLVTIQPVIGCGTCAACMSGHQHLCAEKSVIGVTPSISAAFADRIVVPAANAVALPESMPIEYGALVEPLAVGYHAAVRGRCSADDTVVVVGGGPIGQACALAARRLGVERLLVSEPSAARRSLLEAIGFATCDPTAALLAETVRERFGGPATLILDAVGSSRTLADALDSCVLGGTIVLVGMNEPEVSIPAYAVSTQERSVVGSFCYAPGEFAETAAWVGSAPADLAGLIEDRVGLAEAPVAFRALAKGENTASKVLVRP